MGNWRTVHLQGSVSVDDHPALVKYLHEGYESPEWGCLHSGGLFGLQNWARMNAEDEGKRVKFWSYGNLGERDFTPEDVAEAVRRIKDQVAPSLIVRIDCGGDYEDLDCVATVLVGEDGTVAVLPPMVDRLPEELAPSEDEIKQRMFRMLEGQGVTGWSIG